MWGTTKTFKTTYFKTSKYNIIKLLFLLKYHKGLHNILNFIESSSILIECFAFIPYYRQFHPCLAGDKQRLIYE